MVTIDKVQRGLARYLEEQVLPPMSGGDRWIVTGAATMALAKLPAMIQQAQLNPAVKALGLIGTDGTIDIEGIIKSVKPAARQTTASIKIPFTSGVITLTESDLDTIQRYIEQA
jgi:hypothetical protein